MSETNAITPSGETPPTETVEKPSLIEGTAETNPDGTPKEPVQQTPEEKAAAEAKAAEDAAKAEADAKPITVEEIKLPEGFEARPEALKEFTDILNDTALSRRELVNKLVDLQARETKSLATTFAEANVKAWGEHNDKLQEEARADPDIGGAKLEENLGGISKLIDQYGTPELRQVFTETSAGNHKLMIKFLTNISKALNEGKHVSGTPSDAPTSLASKMYPSMKS